MFWDSFHSFYNFGAQKCKTINVLGEKIVLGAILSNWNEGVYQLVQVTKKHQTFEMWYTADFLLTSKSNEKNTFFKIS